MKRHRPWAIVITAALMVAPIWVTSRSADAAPPSGTTLNDLVAYWSFDDAASFESPDRGGSVLTKGNGASWTANGKFGGALSLNGSSQSLYDTSSPSYLPVGNSSYTQSVWFKPNVVSGDGGLVGWGDYGSTRRVNALRLYENSGGFRHYWWGDDLDCTGAQCPISAGTWYHVASTWDGTTRKLFVNGVLKRSDTPGANNATAANFHIGKTCCSEYFTGLIDDVALYNRALTADEVGELATATITTTTTTTTTTTSTTTTTTTTAPPALDIVVVAPSTSVVPMTTLPVGQSQIPVVSTPVSAAVPKASTSSTTTTTTTVAKKPTDTAPKAPSAPSVISGAAALKVGDKTETATVERADNQLVVSAGALKAVVGGLNPDGSQMALDDDGNVRLKTGDAVRIKLAGFKPSTVMEAWLFSTPVLLGTTKVGADGSVTGTFTIPKNAPEGAHRVVIVAQTTDGKPATLTVGINVGEWDSGPGVALWLIVLPIAFAVVGALVLPAQRRRRRITQV